MDLSVLNHDELRSLQTAVQREISGRDEIERADALARIHAIAKGVGLTLRDILSSSGRHARGPQPIRFQHPLDKSLTWTGLGRKPKWLLGWIKQNGTLEDLRVVSQ